MVTALFLISLWLARLDSWSFAIISPAVGPSSSPEIWTMTPWRPISAPAKSLYHGSSASPPLPKHRRKHHHKNSPAVSPSSFTPPEDGDCGEISCSAPLTRTPIGSPCGCVYPINVVIDVGVDSYALFNLVQELEVEVASGIFLKQSQVKITSAVTSSHGQGRTEVTLYLVPLGAKFDKMTALLIYDRFWQKKVQINRSLFHGYEVVNVHYPGLPSPPPSSFGDSSVAGPSESGGHQFPFTANVSSVKTWKMNVRIISVIAVSSFLLLFLCIVLVIFILKALKPGRLANASGPATSSTARRSGKHKGKGPLDWDARMKIALGSARALAYLHEDSNPRVIHRDFKASNVLLEEDFTPKVSDFGLAREASEGTHHVYTRVMGTFGYVAPEYAMTGHVLIKSDVYSYGVVLLELLSGRKPVHVSGLQDPKNLVVWARPLLGSKEGQEQLIDPCLRENCDLDNLAKVAAVASLCVHEEPSQRPFMGEVVQALKLVCNNKEGAGCEDSLYSQKESDFGPESSWWSEPSPPHGSCVLNMEYSSGSIEEEEMQRRHSVSGLMGRTESQSGPLRAKRKRQAFYRLRGSISEHGHPLKHFHVDGE